MDGMTVNVTSSRLTIGNRLDHLLARFGVRRSRHRVEPGLYRVGTPTPESPVLVTANYTLSFDALRSSLAGIEAYILVLDTKGINVWCAAGKGTFGTDEIVDRVKAVGLDQVVTHRRLVLPQLGAPGIAAHEVKKRSGFRVEYGPVNAADLPEYLRSGAATPRMRRVIFGVKARLALVPVEVVHIVLPVLAVSVVLRILGVIGNVYNVALAGVLAGTVLFPLLLPWIPTQDFSTKGFLVGILAWIPIAWRLIAGGGQWWRVVGTAMGSILVVTAVSAYFSLNFTGSTTFTSRSGVRREIFHYIRPMAWVFGIGLAGLVALIFV